MKNLLLIFFICTFFSCGNSSQENNKFNGTFKYTAYRWNEDNNTLGISLNHYLEINNKGDYKLILRNANGSAGYYYGYVNNEISDKINNLYKDSLTQNYLHDRTTSLIYDGPDFKYEWSTLAETKKINFITPLAPSQIKSLQSALDSLINAPDKKQSAAFNIDSYLKKIIAEDSAFRLKAPPVKISTQFF